MRYLRNWTIFVKFRILYETQPFLSIIRFHIPFYCIEGKCLCCILLACVLWASPHARLEIHMTIKEVNLYILMVRDSHKLHRSHKIPDVWDNDYISIKEWFEHIRFQIEGDRVFLLYSTGVWSPSVYCEYVLMHNWDLENIHMVKEWLLWHFYFNQGPNF